MYPPTFSGRRASQRADELEPFIALLKARKVRSYLEIGARHGDTFHAVMSALPVGSMGVALDWPGAPWGTDKSLMPLFAVERDLQQQGYRIHVAIGDSQSPAVIAKVLEEGPFDAILIDGDHRYDGVAADWRNYGGRASLVAFHDIAGSGQTSTDGLAVEVPRLWREIKDSRPRGKIVEFVGPGSTMGIGAICW